MRLRAAVLVMTLVAGALSLTTSSAQTFRIERKDQGFRVSDRYPTEDFQIQLRVRLDQAGSILDTVGIDAAPVGSWAVRAGSDGRVTFNLWDGRTWSQIDSNKTLTWGQEELITVQRVGGSTMLLVSTGWVRKTLATKLSGTPIFAGDYPPDAHWGSGYNIHQGAVGQIEVLYVGPPKLYSPGFSDFGARIRDERGALSATDRAQIVSAMKALKDKKGWDVGVAFLNGKDGTEGGRAMDAMSHTLRAEGLVPENFAILGYIGNTLRMYNRTSGFDKLVTWDEIKAVWDKQSKMEPQPVVMAMTLSQLAGVSVSVVDTKTDVGVKTDVVIKEGKGEIGLSGGSVTAGGVLVQIPAGALVKPDTLVVKQGVPTIFGDPGVSIEFESSAPTMLKPASIVFPIPPGSDPSKLVALRSLGPNTWITMPLTIDASKGTATALTNHFCNAILLDLGRTTSKFVGTVVSGLGGALILKVLALAPATSGASVVVAIPLLAVGWIKAGSAYDAAQREGLDGPYLSPGFSVFWNPRLCESGPYITFLIDKTNGNLIGPAVDSRVTERQTFIGPATSAPKSTLTYISSGKSYEVATSNVGDLKVPISVLGATGELTTAQYFYESLGFATPPSTTVYIYERLGKSKDKAKETNSGEWDGKVLQINSKKLNPEPPNSADSRAASCHEYWHAVSSHNGFSEMWTGAEEAIAVAMESLVWASPSGLPETNLMEDFVNLHAWNTCTPVLRSGLYSVGVGEVADTRGYKQWPLLKYIFHKMGKEAFVDVIRGRLSPAKLDEAVIGLALAGIISEQVINDPATFDHPLYSSALTRTGFQRPSIIEDEKATSLKFGETDLPKASRAAINAFNVSVPERAAGSPASPIIVRRRWLGREHFYALERVYAGKPSSGSTLPMPLLSDMKTDPSVVVLPEAWDGAGRMPVMFVTSSEAITLAPPTMPSNPVYVYRLAPPTDVRFEHLPSVTDADAKSRFTWTLPALGGSLEAKDTVAAYRLYGRKAGQNPVMLAEFVLRGTHEKDWYAAPQSAVPINPDAKSADIAIVRSVALGYDEFAMSSVDGLAKKDGKPLESPIGWAGGSSLLAALDKCNLMTFSAHLSFEGSITNINGNDPPQVQNYTYPVSGAVNAPDVWGFSSSEFATGKLSIKNGHVEYKWTGELKSKNAKSADSLLDALNAYNPMWPFNSGSAFEGVTTVSFVADIGPDGRLSSAVLTVNHPQYGCSIKFGDIVPGVVKIDGNNIQITYMVGAPEATAKSSGHSAWMRWIYTNGSAEFRMTKYLSMRAINLNFTKR